MTRTFTPIDLVALPRLDAASAVTVAQSLITAAHDKKVAKAIKKETAITALVSELATERDALQAAFAVAEQASPSGQKRDADRREDAAVGAVYDLLSAWARLDGEIPLGTVAAEVRAAVFGTATLKSITQAPVAQEWAAVDSKLKLIDSAGHAAAIASLGAKPLLDHLRAVHIAYGEVIGATKVLPEVEAPVVRDRRMALTDTFRDYIIQVTAAARRKVKPLDGAVVDALLRPLAEWSPTVATAATTSDPVTPPVTTGEAPKPA